MHDGENCAECGMPVAFFTRSWWEADDELWNDVMGEGNPIVVCPGCFATIAKARGIWLHWKAVRGV